MTKYNISVSVIVPNYNYARYLKARIKSILDQTFQDFELILLDDCSTDNSREILESYRDNPHVSHIIFNEKNSGSPFAQWLKGISLAKGKYIWIAEADDLSDCKFLESITEKLKQNPNAVIAFSGSHCIDEDGRPLDLDFDRWTSTQLLNPSKFSNFNGKKYAQYNQYWKNYIYNASGVVFRKDTVSKIHNKKWEKMRCCGDWLYWTLIAIQGDVIEVYEYLNYFRRHSTSTIAKSVQNGINFEESILVINEIEHIVPKIGIYRRWVNRGNCYKQVKRNLSGARKQELLFLMENIFGHMRFTYFIARLNKYLSLISPKLNFAKYDRLINP